MDDLAKLCQYNRGMFIVLYADDILLLAPSIRELQLLLQKCEAELIYLDMTINVLKNLPVYVLDRGTKLYVSLSAVYLVFLYHG